VWVSTVVSNGPGWTLVSNFNEDVTEYQDQAMPGPNGDYSVNALVLRAAALP
jgi:hypothetical protein